MKEGCVRGLETRYHNARGGRLLQRIAASHNDRVGAWQFWAPVQISSMTAADSRRWLAKFWNWDRLSSKLFVFSWSALSA